ncbi:hypothetical protein CPB83DRAFT_647027 [Crepidotus variabilis]|uniref:Uncharacterized protein n=1 Tax=Crepidotus variabilis TaxID=179855 RepID=A0A9P6E7I9_9AGAR|nr:hypothetical protein CPB83DRAFT_647027 [Crepidotus variabilis]
MPGNTPPEVAPFPLKYTIPLHSFFDISHLTATPDNQLYLGAPEKAPQPGTHIVNLVARTDNSQLPIGDFFSIPEITPTPTQHSVLLHPYNEVSKDIPEISNRDLPQITVNLDLNEPLSSGESVLKTEQMIETSTSEKEASVPTTQPTLLAKRPDNDSLGSSIVEVDASVASMLVLTNIAEGKAIMNEPSLRHLARAAFSVIQSVMVGVCP